MRAGRIARPPLLPVRVGRLDVDEFVPEPHSAQSQVRIEPDVSLNESIESVFCIFQQIILWQPLDCQLGPYLDRRFCHGVDDLWLVVYVIDTELDQMLDAAGLD